MKAVIFARVSNQENKKEILINCQIDKLKNFCENRRINGNHEPLEILKIFRFFEDDEIDLASSESFREVIEFMEKQDDNIAIVLFRGKCRENNNFRNKIDTLRNKRKLEIKAPFYHPVFNEPSDNTKIWRYISLSKFLDFLQTKTLHFTNAVKMREIDKWECKALTQKDSLLMNDDKSMSNSFNEYALKGMYLNCWHMNGEENYAMWRIYSNKEGLAIQSTYKKLYTSFVDQNWSFYDEGNKKIHIGQVNYYNTSNYGIPKENGFQFSMHKRSEYEYEQELRCVINDYDAKEKFLKVVVNPETLINKIRIHPNAEKGFKDSIYNLCNKYDFKFKIEPSGLT